MDDAALVMFILHLIYIGLSCVFCVVQGVYVLWVLLRLGLLDMVCDCCFTLWFLIDFGLGFDS